MKGIKETLLDILRKEDKKANNIDTTNFEDLNINSDFGFDSLKTVELFMSCESVFGIEFTDDEIFQTKTFGDLIDKIDEKLR